MEREPISISTTSAAIFIFAVTCFSCDSPKSISTEVLVIGGTTSGVAAALGSARMNVNTVLLEESTWLGGMLTSAGVSAVDGNKKLPSGIWGEFRDSLIAHYGSEKSIQTGWVSNTMFEPSLGNRIFQNMARHETSLTTYFTTKLDTILASGQGWRVTATGPAGTLIIDAKVVIDCTELGDIAKMVGIGYNIGMDSKDTFNESIAPEKENDIIQDLTYVMVLKDYGMPALIAKPEGYDASVFYCSSQSDNCDEAQTMNRTLWPKEKLITYGALPNGKFMINWPINGNDFYVNAIDNEAERQREFDKAKLKSLQFLYYLQTELEFSNLSLADDEFPTEDGFPLTPYHRESRRIRGEVTLTVNDIARPYDQKFPLYRTGIAVGDYPVDHHHAAHPNAVQLPELHFYPVPSYSVPLGVLIPEKVENFIVAEKSISVSNIANGTTRLQPVVLQLGQAAGTIAAMAVKDHLLPRNVSIRKVQHRLLENGAYLLPYLDVPKSHPHFKAYQRIGSTGILKGRGMNVGWENQTWFYPDSLLNGTELLEGLQALNIGSEITLPESLTNQEMLQWIVMVTNRVRPELILPTWCANTEGVRNYFSMTEFKDDQLMTRGQFAIIMDAIFDPFEFSDVDLRGNFILK